MNYADQLKREQLRRDYTLKKVVDRLIKGVTDYEPRRSFKRTNKIKS